MKILTKKHTYYLNKNIILILRLCLFICLFIINPNIVLSQHKSYCTSSRILSIEKDSFSITPLLPDIPWFDYLPHYLFAFGKVIEKNKVYYLNADQKILENQGVCTNFTTLFRKDTTCTNKVSIEFASPYEEKIKSNYYRVYNYYAIFSFQLKNKDTIIVCNDTTSQLSIDALPNGKIKKIEIIITYHPTYYATHEVLSYTTYPWCKMMVDSIPEGVNSIKIEMPTFEYFSLAYANYQNYRTSIRNKNIIIDGYEFAEKPKNLSMWSVNRKINLYEKNKKSHKNDIINNNVPFSPSSNSKYYLSDSILLVLRNGLFYEMSLQQQSTSLKYPTQNIYSYGYYIKKNNKYYLIAADEIFENQGICKNFELSFDKDTTNHICVEFSSPYEKQVKQGYNRVYNYHVSFLFSQNGKDTVVTRSDTLQKISINALSNGILKEVKVTVTYHPLYYATGNILSFTKRPWCTISIDSIPNNANFIKIEMPTFEYFTLSYARYRYHTIPMQGKTLLFKGRLFKKILL